MKRRDLKIFWSSNAYWSRSGYANFSKDLTARLVKDSWPTAFGAWAGLAMGTLKMDGMTVYPQMEDPMGTDALFHHANAFGANVRFSMQDVWPMNAAYLQQMNNWIPYVPIDRDEVPQGVLNNLRFAYKIITFSAFGQRTLAKAGFASTMIPEGVDTELLKPIDKIQARKDLNFPLDKFVVGMIGANKPDMIPRKGWQQALEAFKLFHDAHPDSVFYYNTNQPGGFDIEGYANHLGIKDAIVTTPLYQSIYHTTDELRNKLYNAFDLVLHPSTTEGFGLVVVESQAAGTPVIVNNCHSMPELIVDGKTGSISDYNFKMWAPGGGYVYFADPNSVYEKMEYWYKALNDNENKVTNDCRNWVKANYDIDKIYEEKWVPYMEQLQSELLPPIDNSSKKE